MFSKPHVVIFFILATCARLSYGTVGFALLLLLEQATDSYALAGAGLVAYGLTASLLAPLRGRLVDRWGRKRALPPLALVSALLFCACSGLAEPLGGNAAALVGLTGLSGCFLPPLGPVTRGVWADVADTPEIRRAAYSLDTIAEEGLFTVGPVVVGVVVAVASPRAALLLTALLLFVGTVGMTRSRLLLPSENPATVEATTMTAEPVRGALHVPGFALFMVVLFGAGLGLGGVEIATVAFADSLGGPAQAGVLLATFSLASALGGAVYGTRGWSGTPLRHLSACCIALGLGLSVLALASRSGSLVAFGAAAFLLGLFVAPLLVAAYTSADDLATDNTRTQASTLVGTLNNLGATAGTAATGLLVDTAGTSAALLAGGAVLLLTGALAVGMRSPDQSRP